MPRRRPHLIIVHRCVLIGELAAPSDSLVEKVYPWTHAVWIWLVSGMDLGLHFPRLPIAVLRIQIVEVLCPVGLFLATRWPLPLLKLLERLAIGVVNRHHGLAESLAHECLQLVLNLRLLLLQVV